MCYSVGAFFLIPVPVVYLFCRKANIDTISSVPPKPSSGTAGGTAGGKPASSGPAGAPVVSNGPSCQKVKSWPDWVKALYGC